MQGEERANLLFGIRPCRRIAPCRRTAAGGRIRIVALRDVTDGTIVVERMMRIGIDFDTDRVPCGAAAFSELAARLRRRPVVLFAAQYQQRGNRLVHP